MDTPPPHPPSLDACLSFCATSLHHSPVWQYWWHISYWLTVRGRQPGYRFKRAPIEDAIYPYGTPGSSRAPLSEDKVGDWNTVIIKRKCFFAVASQLLFFVCSELKVWRRLSSLAQWLGKKRRELCQQAGSCLLIMWNVCCLSVMCWCGSHLFFFFSLLYLLSM